jgi:hypothetical protein
LDREKKPRAKLPSLEMSVLPTVSGVLGRRRLSDDTGGGNKQDEQKHSKMILWIGRKPIGVLALLCKEEGDVGLDMLEICWRVGISRSSLLTEPSCVQGSTRERKIEDETMNMLDWIIEMR